MSKCNLLKEYKKNVVELQNRAKILGLSKKEVNQVFKESFVKLQNELNGSNLSQTNKAQKICTNLKNVLVLFTASFIFIYILLNVHQPTTSIVLRNVQGLTYPTLKFVRYLSVPIIKLFPALTDLYDETCLVENPYFYVADMECWPCENVFTVLNISKFEDSYLKSGTAAPYIVKSTQKTVNFEKLKYHYEQNKKTLNKETRRLKSTNSSIITLEDLFGKNNNLIASDPDLHISWRITKMTSARIIRQLFPKPFFLPDRSGQSVERFVMIDGVQSGPYVLPNTECSYVFITQGSGERTIVLKPSKECTSKCRTISVILRPSYILSYNWWYWRPISLPVTNATGPSVTYINSYC
ncbi:uncharacterized protein LOC130902391 [Diorhabda carinulata]|uniref:uncharacterized protein LOC130902391 n=1 Tax=Diorhabda carinulata TaxID=1163345 RepID=UPI0025A011A4|nr:uncharacterized protein LOC130902391 [Diorhabda carinulata]